MRPDDNIVSVDISLEDAATVSFKRFELILRKLKECESARYTIQQLDIQNKFIPDKGCSMI